MGPSTLISKVWVSDKRKTFLGPGATNCSHSQEFNYRQAASEIVLSGFEIWVLGCSAVRLVQNRYDASLKLQIFNL